MNFFDKLTVAFIVLKLIGVIGWSWTWVLAPMWIPIMIYLIFKIIESFYK